jgi:predicted RNA-binding Zn ribbon-like protein
MANREKLSKQTRAHGALPGFPRLLAGRLCLDFVNTLEKLDKDGPQDYLPGYTELAQWGQHIRLVSEQAVADALQWQQDHPGEAAELYARGMHLRSCLTRIFTALAYGREPDARDVQIVQAEFAQPGSALVLPPDVEHFQWQWASSDRLVERLLWEVAKSSIQTLTTDDLHRIKECPGANDCGSIFYDTSRNGTRRWCSMEGCGSRVKMRRQYARHVPSDV